MVPRDWTDGIGGVDQDTVEQESAGYPVIQFIKGKQINKKAGDFAYTGGWFIKDESAPSELDGVMPAPWEPYEMVHQSGESTPGWACRDLTVALVRSRHCWEYEGEDGQIAYAPWQGGYEKGRSGKVHVLACIKGLEPYPLVITIKGWSSKVFTEELVRFRRNVILPANALVRPKRWPYRAFWVTLGPERDGKGEPTFSKAGSGDKSQTYTFLTLDAPNKPLTKEELGQRYVGDELRDQLQNWYSEAEEWAHAWDEERTSGQDGASEPDSNGTEPSEDEPAAMDF